MIESTLDLCRENLEEGGIRLSVETTDPSLKILCRPAEISQIILNLLNNSKTAIADVNEKWIKISARALGEKAELSVNDSGPGISKDVSEKIFHPFFSTNEVGRGVGLGLSVSKGIAEAHGGSLDLNSKCPNTQFVLTLPRYKPG